jgi:hypothetical protein
LKAAELLLAAEQARADLLGGKGDAAITIRLENLSARALSFDVETSRAELGHVSILWRVLLVLDGTAAFLVGK